MPSTCKPFTVSLYVLVSEVLDAGYCFLSLYNKRMSFQVLAYGPGGLPVWCESVNPLHMADCMAEWRHFGVTLVPTNDGSVRESGSYHVRSGREDSRRADPGKKRLLVLMLFLDLPESHSTASKLCELDITYTMGSGQYTLLHTHCCV